MQRWLLFGAAVLLLSCGPERQNFIARNYHTFVSYFNGYYHAEQRFRLAQREIELKTPDPIDSFLRVFPLIEPSLAREQYGRLEEATKKCEVIIFRHKNGRYLDDCRTLIGQCWVLRSNLPSAQQNFTYVLNAFPQTPLRAKIYWWEAYAALQEENPYRAETRLTDLLGLTPKQIPKKLKPQAEALLAQALIAKGEPHLALPFLERSAGKLDTRLRRARAYYLLGQLYLHQNKPDKALAAFQKAVRLNPTNQLTFQAQLQKSLILGTKEPRFLRQLERMARQARYEDFRDQIYYRLGQIAAENKNYDAALTYYKKAGSSGNSPARALAHYEAGNLYFIRYQDLASAQKHYDSAAKLIPENHPKASEIKALQARFGEYARLRNDLNRQDSLLRLAELSPQAQEQAIEAYIQTEVSRRAAEKAKTASASSSAAPPPNPFFQQQSKSSFYFDNPVLVSQGKQEFIRLWGERPNEDHWRQNQKGMRLAGAPSSTPQNKPNTTDSTQIDWPDNPADLTPQKLGQLKKRLLATIPKSPEAKRNLEDSLITTALMLAQLYQEAFQQPDSAKSTYLWLRQRLPHREAAQIPALYGLYVVHLGTPEALPYKNELLQKYPDSEYAQRLRGENRFASISSVEDIHTALLEAYARNEYETVTGFGLATQKRWEGQPIEPAIRYLIAAAYVHQQNIQAAIPHLQVILKNFPQAACTPLAQKLLSRLEKGQTQILAESAPSSPPTSAEPTRQTSAFNLETRAGEPILVVILVPKDKITSEELKQHLARTNQSAFADSKLNLVVFLYNQTHHLGYIAQFGDYKAAHAYLEVLQAQAWFTQLGLKAPLDAFPISQSNFRIAFTQKRMQEYAAFYAQTRPSMR